MAVSTLKNKIPPKQQKQALGVFSVIVVYCLFGFLAAPTLVKKFAQHYVHDELKLELTLDHIEINPLQLAVRLDGLKIGQPQGETLVAAKSVYLNSSLVLSLWQRGLYIDELDLQQPYVNAHINKQGKLNLLKLLPPEDKDEGTTRWQLVQLGIHQAHIDLVDDSRSVPFRSQLTAFNMKLYNISSMAGNHGKYQFSAQTEKNERLSWQGSVSVQPLQSQGHLIIEKMQLDTLADYLADELPLQVQHGVLNIEADYQFRVNNEQPDLQVSNGRVLITDIKTLSKTAQPLAPQLQQFDAQGLAFAWPQLQARFGSIVLNEFNLAGRVDGARPVLQFAKMVFTGGSWQAAQDTFSLVGMAADNMVLWDGNQPLVHLPKIAVEHFVVNPDKQFLDTGLIKVNGGVASVQMLDSGRLNWQQALATLSARLSPPEAKPADAKPWNYALGQLQVEKFLLAAEDQRYKPVIKEPVMIRQLTVNPELDLSRPHKLSANIGLGTGGDIRLAGELQESPLLINSRLEVSHLALPPLAAYFSNMARLHLESGDLDMDGQFHLQQQPSLQANFSGMVGINQFAANDLKLNERFLAWKKLVANGLKWQLEPMSIGIKEVQAEQPFTRVIIAPDKTINLEQVVVSDNAAGHSQSAETMPITIDKLKVSNGSMLFADLTLNPQFATGIQSLNGELKGISTAKNSHASIALDGRVDQYGKALINGALNPFNPDKNTDVAVKFQNVELTTLTPYSAKFAGYRIDKGKLSLELNYKIQQRQLNATNKIVLSQLTLGDKVDSPDAVSLPLRLAIALLKDSDGMIDLDIPITGSLDDPKFRVGPIVWQAIVNVLTKVATAPFRFIAGLVDGGDDIDSLTFDPGSAVLATEGQGKLAKLAQALGKRPALRLEIRGSFDALADADALRRLKYRQALDARLAQNPRKQQVLEAWYGELLGKEALKQQRALNLKPLADSRDQETLALVPNAYLQALENALIVGQPVAEGELRQLALDRARSIRSQLIDKNQIAEGRVFVLEPESVSANDKHLIITRVSLNSD